MKYPCTGYVDMKGFGTFLEAETAEPRRNMTLFTQELQQYLHAPWMSLVNSGSSANLVAAMAMAEKLRREGKPLTAAVSAFSFPTTVSALHLAGFRITAVDVEEGGFNVSPAALRALPELPSLLAVTHFLGYACAIREIAEMAHAAGSYVLQDACETLGLRAHGRPVHEFGDITTLSFYHPHHLSSYGGGAVICRERADYVLCDSIAHWGRACRCHIPGETCTVPAGPAHQFTYGRPGLNVEISELNACFGRWQLRRVAEMEAARHARFRCLHGLLSGVPGLRVYPEPGDGSSAFVFPVRLENGMDIRGADALLRAEGIEMRTLMGGAANEQEAFRGGILAAEPLPAAHAMAETAFFVGIHHTLPMEAVQHVGTRLAQLLGGSGA